MKRRWLKRTLFVVIALALFGVVGVAALRSWERALMDGKAVRELSGIVKNKGYRKFTEENATQVAANVAQLAQPLSSRDQANERQRIAAGKLHTAIVPKEQYDKIDVGP